MKDIDSELLRLRKLRDNLSEEMAKEELRHIRNERMRLGLAVLAASAAAVLSLPFQKVSLIGVHLPGMQWVVLGLFFVACLGLFLWQAHKSPLGINGYLKIEKTLLIHEMPNIFQILSLLGFLSVFLKETWIKLTVALTITVLLMIYLTAKRREMLARSPKLKAKITSRITVPLSLVLGFSFSTLVYWIATLIAAQV